MMKQFLVVNEKRFTRTYAEGIKLDDVSEWIERLKEDEWTEFHLEEITGAEDLLWAMGDDEEKSKLRFDIYAWREL